MERKYFPCWFFKFSKYYQQRFILKVCWWHRHSVLCSTFYLSNGKRRIFINDRQEVINISHFGNVKHPKYTRKRKIYIICWSHWIRSDSQILPEGRGDNIVSVISDKERSRYWGFSFDSDLCLAADWRCFNISLECILLSPLTGLREH